MDEKRFVITITNQFASTGRVIAKRLSKLLGVTCYNEYIVQETAKALNLPEDVVDQIEERSKRQVADSFFPTLFQSHGSRTNDTQNRIFETQEQIIRTLAERENCIIVGRCSDFVLEGTPNTVHIYIFAPYADRVKHCMSWKNIDEETARRMIAAQDETRISYHMNYAGYAPDDKGHKDLLINASLLGTDGTAQLLADVICKRFGLTAEESRAHRLPRQHRPSRQ